jgi:hypothetical protein
VPAYENNVISNAIDHINQWIFCDPNRYIASLVNNQHLYFDPYACIKHILAIVVGRWSIFSQNVIPTYQKYHLKFNRSQQPIHIYPPKYEYCMFALKNQALFSHSNATIANPLQKSTTYFMTHMWIIVILATFHSLIYLVYLHPFKHIM